MENSLESVTDILASFINKTIKMSSNNIPSSHLSLEKYLMHTLNQDVCVLVVSHV